MQPNLASIDVGTNTIRLWIGEIEVQKILTLHTDRANVRLGEGLRNGTINQKALARTVPVLRRYKELIKKYAVQHFRSVGTSVFRHVNNSKEIVEWISEKTDIPIDVISGEEEARLCAKGVLWHLPRLHDRVLVVDVGGGSTELIRVQNSRIEGLHSLELGAVYLTEAYLKHDPPLDSEIDDLEAYIEDHLKPMAAFAENGYAIVGTAGTATSLAAIDLSLHHYVPDLVHGHVLTANKLLALFNRLRLKKARERLSLPGVESGREDIILAGLILWIAVLRFFYCPEMMVSHRGILEGIAIDLWERNKRPCCMK